MRPGERFDDYTIVSEIGEGGMSVVYLAERASDRAQVIVKELKDQYRFDRRLIDRFFREAEILQHLRHPHLARVFAGLERDGKYYIIQEYLSGGSLADLLRERKPYAEHEAIRWCRDALRAMNYAHENGVVHRDLKPSNLMLDAQRQVKVIDFGIARHFGEARLTRTGDGIMGTAEYMSPEQILTPDKVDHLTDVYSMGVVLYELLTGALPFDGDTPFAVYEKITRHTPPPLRQLGHGITPMRVRATGIDTRLAKIVLRAMDKRSERRFGGCAEFALQLDRYLSEGSRASGPRPAWPGPARQRVLAGALMLVVVVFLIWGLSGSDTQQPQGQEQIGQEAADRKRAEDERQKRLAAAALKERIEADRKRQEDGRKEQDLIAATALQEKLRLEAERKRQDDERTKQEAIAAAALQDKIRLEAERKHQDDERTKQEAIAAAALQDKIRLEAERKRQDDERKKQEAIAAAALQDKIRLEAERRRQDDERKKQEAIAAAALQDKIRLEAERKRQEDERKKQPSAEAEARFFAAIMGTWTREEEDRTGASRTLMREVLRIDAGCTGLLTRTVTTYDRGFAGWKQVNSDSSSLPIRCDGTGRLIGDPNTRISPQGGMLQLGTSIFARR